MSESKGSAEPDKLMHEYKKAATGTKASTAPPPAPYATTAGAITIDGQQVAYDSPRMTLAMKQTGISRGELRKSTLEKFEKAARREGLSQWKEVAARRAAATERRRGRVLTELVRTRAKLVASGDPGLLKGPAPEQRSAQAEAAVKEQAKKAIVEGEKQMARIMESAQQRLEMVQKVEAGAAKLRMEREEASAKVELKFAEKKLRQQKEAEARKKAAMEWEIQRAAKKEVEEKIMREEGVKALAAMEARDAEIEEQRRKVREEAAEIGVRFRVERKKKLDSIMAQHRSKEQKLAVIAAASVKKQAESEAKVRWPAIIFVTGHAPSPTRCRLPPARACQCMPACLTRLAGGGCVLARLLATPCCPQRVARVKANKEKIERENRERTEVAIRRLAAHERRLVIREEQKEQAAEERFAKVDARLEKMEAIKQAEIAAARKRADEAAAGRGEEFEKRARLRVSTASQPASECGRPPRGRDRSEGVCQLAWHPCWLRARWLSVDVAWPAGC